MTNLTIDEALPVEDKKEHSGRAKAAEMDAIVNSQDRQTEVGQEEDRRKQKAAAVALRGTITASAFWRLYYATGACEPRQEGSVGPAVSSWAHMYQVRL